MQYSSICCRREKKTNTSTYFIYFLFGIFLFLLIFTSFYSIKWEDLSFYFNPSIQPCVSNLFKCPIILTEWPAFGLKSRHTMTTTEIGFTRTTEFYIPWLANGFRHFATIRNQSWFYDLFITQYWTSIQNTIWNGAFCVQRITAHWLIEEIIVNRDIERAISFIFIYWKAFWLKMKLQPI